MTHLVLVSPSSIRCHPGMTSFKLASDRNFVFQEFPVSKSVLNKKESANLMTRSEGVVSILH